MNENETFIKTFDRLLLFLFLASFITGIVLLFMLVLNHNKWTMSPIRTSLQIGILLGGSAGAFWYTWNRIETTWKSWATLMAIIAGGFILSINNRQNDLEAVVGVATFFLAPIFLLAGAAALLSWDIRGRCASRQPNLDKIVLFQALTLISLLLISWAIFSLFPEGRVIPGIPESYVGTFQLLAGISTIAGTTLLTIFILPMSRSARTSLLWINIISVCITISLSISVGIFAIIMDGANFFGLYILGTMSFGTWVYFIWDWMKNRPTQSLSVGGSI